MKNHRSAGGNSSVTYPDGKEREFNHVSKAHDSKKKRSAKQPTISKIEE